MATILRYFISGSNPDLLELGTPGPEYVLTDQQVVVAGSTGSNVVHAASGVELDARNLLKGEDVVVFNHRWNDYKKDISTVSGAIVFSYTDAVTHLTEKITVLNGSTTDGKDKLIFADGALITSDANTALRTTSATAPLGSTTYGLNISAADVALIKKSSSTTSVWVETTTSSNYVQPTPAGNTLRAFASTTNTNGKGATFAMGEAGQNLVSVGTTQVDKVYVKAGAVVDARNLLKGEDQIYFTGNWGDYTKSLTAVSGAIQFTRDVSLNGKNYTEKVTVLNGSTTDGNDKLVFADGAVLSKDANTALRTTRAPTGGTTLGLTISATDVALMTSSKLAGGSAWDPTSVTPFLSTPPTTSDKTLTATEDTDYVLGLADFPFADADQNELSEIIISTLPSAGTLKHQTADNQWHDVTLNQSISKADIQAGRLVYTPAQNANGTGVATIGFKVKDTGSGQNTSAAHTLTMDVTAVNDAPVRSSGALPTFTAVNEDSSNDTATSLGLSSVTYGNGASNESDQTLTVTITGIPDFITLWKADGTQVSVNGQITVAELQGLQYKTVADASGKGSVTWTVSDNGRTDNHGVDTLTGESLSVTVNAVVFNFELPEAEISNLDVDGQIVISATSLAGTPSDVTAVSGKKIHLVHTTDPTRTQDIDVTDTRFVTIVGNKVIIKPPFDFDFGASYRVEVDANAFTATVAGVPATKSCAMVQDDGLNFGTVNIGAATSVATAAQGQVVSDNGTVAYGKKWINGSGQGDWGPGETANFDLSGGDYAVVVKDGGTSGARANVGDGVEVNNGFNLSLSNVGSGDRIYVDDRANNKAALNNSAFTQISGGSDGGLDVYFNSGAAYDGKGSTIHIANTEGGLALTADAIRGVINTSNTRLGTAISATERVGADASQDFGADLAQGASFDVKVSGKFRQGDVVQLVRLDADGNEVNWGGAHTVSPDDITNGTTTISQSSLTDLAQGRNTIYAKVTSADGAVTKGPILFGAQHGFDYDTTAPAPVLSVADVEDDLTPADSEDGTLIDTETSVSIHVDGWTLGDSLQLYVGDQALGSAITLTEDLLNNGDLYVRVNKADLGDAGIKSITATLTDRAGNMGTTAAALTLDVKAYVQMSGSLYAGPVMEGNDLVVTAYDAAGNILAQDTTVEAGTGRYSLNILSTYKGPVLIKVSSVGSQGDYRDEGTGQATDLQGNVFYAVSTATGSAVTANVTPLTDVAAKKLMTGEQLSAGVGNSDVQNANAVVSKLFLGQDADITQQSVTPTINANGTANTGSANLYGQVLEQISKQATAGKTFADVQADLVAGVNWSKGAATSTAALNNSAAAQAQVLAKVQYNVQNSAQTKLDITLKDLTNLGITGVDSLTDVRKNALLDAVKNASSLADVSSVDKLQTFVQAELFKPVATLAFDTGSSNSDGITNDGHFNITGLSSNAVGWEYSSDKGKNWQTGSGSSFELGAGAYEAGVVRVRQAGASGSTGNLAKVVIDKAGSIVAPSCLSVIDGSQTASNPAAGISDRTPEFVYSLSGTDAVIGDQLVLYKQINGVKSEAGRYTLMQEDITNHQAKVVVKELLAQGLHSFSVTLVDMAGNASGPSAAVSVQVNATPTQTVTLTSVSDNVGSLKGVLGSGATTDDNQPTLSGTLNGALTEGQVLGVYDGSTKLGEATVTDLNWSFRPATALAAGLHQLSARVDASGGYSGPSSADSVTFRVQAISFVPAIDDIGAVTGPIASGGTTDDAMPTIKGTLATDLASGETVAIYDNNTLLGTAQVNGLNWTLTPSAPLSAATHSFVAKILNASNTALVESSAFTITTTSAAPTKTVQTLTSATTGDNVGTNSSVQGALVDGRSTDDTTPSLTGTLSASLGAGEVVAVYDGATRLGTATVTTTTWTYTPTALSEGKHALTARVENTATGLNGAFNTTPFNVNVVTGISIGSVSDDAGAVVGIVAAGGTTDDTTPTLSGTLTAALATGEKVSIYNGATKLGEATINGTSWSYTPGTALAAGTYSFIAKVEDAAGTNVLVASAARALTVAIATAPTTTVQTLTSATTGDNVNTNSSVQGALVDGRSTDDTTPSLTGTLSAVLGTNEVLAVYDGTTRLGTATVTTTTWTYTPTALSEGKHAFTARVENTATSLNGAFNTTPFNVNVMSAVTIDSVADDAGAVVGIVAAGGTTDDTTPTLSGTLTAALATGEKVSIYNGATKLGEATVNGTSWSYTPGTALAAGTYSFIAKVEDAAGTNVLVASAARALTVAIATAPTTTVQTLTSATTGDNVNTNSSVQGALVDGRSTDDTTPSLTGTLSAALVTNEVLAVYDGTTRLGTATVTTTSWTYTTPALGEGKHAFTARVENTITGLNGAFNTTAFNVNVMSAVTIDSVIDNVGTVLGAVAAGGVTDDTTPTLSGTLKAVLATGEKVSIYNGATKLGEATVNGTSWSYTPGTALAAGAYNFTAKVENAAGTNVLVASAAQALTVVTTTTAPTATLTLTATDNNSGTLSSTGTVTGALSNTRSTDETRPTFSGAITGTLAAGDVVVLYDGDTRVTNPTVSGATWSYAPGTTYALGMGLHNFKARVENTATGLKGAFSTALNVNIVGKLSIDRVSDDVGLIVGVVADGGTTDDSTPTITGTLSGALLSGEKLSIYNGATKLGQATVNGTSWSYTPGTALAAGAYSLTAKVEDASNNVLLTSPTRALTLAALSAPTPTTTVTLASAATGDNVATNGSVQGVLVDGRSTDDNTANLAGTLSAALGAGEVVAVYDGATRLGTAIVTTTTWTYTTLVLGEGKHVFTARVENTITGLNGQFNTTPFNVNVVSAVTIDSVADDVGTVLGAVAAGGVTDDNTPTLSGSLKAALVTGEKVVIYNGASKLGEATVNGTSWSYTPTLLAGSYSLTAKVEDAAGNALVVSAARALTVDNSTNVPAQTVKISGVADDVVTNGSVSNATGTLVSTDDTTPSLSGTTGALGGSEVVAVYDTVNGVRVKLGNATVTGTFWSYTPGTALAAGTHQLSAVVENAASGLQGTFSDAQTVKIHTGLSVTLSDDVGTLTGTVATGGVTDDGMPTLSGVLTVDLARNEELAVYDTINGIRSKLGTATLSGLNWNFTPSANLANGLHSLQVMVQPVDDTSAKAGRVVSAPVALTVDTSVSAPVQTVSILAVTDDVTTNGSVSNTTGTLVSTDDTTPTLSGKLTGLLVGAQVVGVYDTVNGNQVRLGTATIDGTGTGWTFTPSSGLTAGTHQLSALVENTANGLKGSFSAAQTLNIHTGLNVTLNDDVGGLQGPVVSCMTDDRTPTLSGTLGVGLAAGEELAVYDTVNGVRTKLGTATFQGLNWSYTPTDLSYDIHKMDVMVQPTNDNSATAGRVVAASREFQVVTQGVTVTGVIDTGGPITGNLLQLDANGKPPSGSLPTVSYSDGPVYIEGALIADLTATQKLGVFYLSTFLGFATVTGKQFSFAPDFTNLGYIVNFNLPLSFAIRDVDASNNVVDTFMPSTPLTVRFQPLDTAVTTSGNVFSMSGRAYYNNNATLDLTAIGDATQGQAAQPAINKVDLTGAGNNTLKLNVSDVLAVTAPDLFTTEFSKYLSVLGTGKSRMVVTGDAGDAVNMLGTGWTAQGATVVDSTNNHSYSVYNNGSAQLLIDTLLTRQGAVL